MGAFFMHALYILYSQKLDRYYVGQANDPAGRLLQHNSPENHNWTKAGAPWVLKAVIQFGNATLARKAEYWLKQQKSSTLLEEIVAERDKALRHIHFTLTSDC